MIPRVLEIDSSIVVSLPEESLKEIGVRIGDQVDVKIDRERRAIIVRPVH